MSLQTWIDEFYPIGADTVANTGNMMAIVEASLLKWEGLRPENLQKHECRLDINRDVREIVPPSRRTFPIHGGTCSLCSAYFRHGNPIEGSCSHCPLYQTRGQRCDYKENESPWAVWTDKLDPLPMIEALRSTKQFVLEGKYVKPD